MKYVSINAFKELVKRYRECRREYKRLQKIIKMYNEKFAEEEK